MWNKLLQFVSHSLSRINYIQMKYSTHRDGTDASASCTLYEDFPLCYCVVYHDVVSSDVTKRVSVEGTQVATFGAIVTK